MTANDVVWSRAASASSAPWSNRRRSGPESYSPRRQPLATMHALAHRQLARAGTDAFAEIVIAEAERLRALTFRLLCQRVLRRHA